MTELTLPTQEIQDSSLDILGGFKWEKKPDPVIADASEAFQRQKGKPSKLIDLLHLDIQNGIHILPRWAGCELLKVGQRRGWQDLQTRGQSRHNVSFGTAEIRLPDGKKQLLRVAIKPFERMEKAIEDARMNSLVLDRGISTTNPICVLVDNPRGFIITPTKPAVQVLDTEPWQQYQPGPEEVRKHFQERLECLGNLLADLNSKGINHADGQLKNFWVLPDGTMEPFDWESASITDSNPPTNTFLVEIAVSTLRPFYRSLENTGALKRIPQQQWEQFDLLVFRFYQERLLNILGESYLDSVTIIEERLKEKLGI